jgi:hypothetical protein
MPGQKTVCDRCGFPGAAPASGATMTLAAPTGAPPAFGAGPANPNGPPMPGRLRPVPIGKTILLGIITFGIYVQVRSYKLSGDLQRLQGGSQNWQTFFWLQLIPYAGIVFTLILYYKNNKMYNAVAPQRGLQPSMTPFILACIPIVNIAAPFVWASQYNGLANRM